MNDSLPPSLPFFLSFSLPPSLPSFLLSFLPSLLPSFPELLMKMDPEIFSVAES